MRAATIAILVAATLPCVLLSGCSQNSQGKTRPAPEAKSAPPAKTVGDLGTLTFTNHIEREIGINPATVCRIKPQKINRQDIELTITIESKKSNGKPAGLQVSQVIAHQDQSMDIRLGDIAISLTPQLAE